MASPNGEPRYSDQRIGVERYGTDGDSWHPRAPTWTEEASHGGTCVRNNERPVGGQMVASSGEPFMAPLGWGKRKFKGNIRMTNQHIYSGWLTLSEKSKIWVMQRSMEQEGERSTARQSLMATDDSGEGCHCNKCGRHRDGGSSWEHKFNTPLTEEIDEKGENWFKSENSPSERRTMM